MYRTLVRQSDSFPDFYVICHLLSLSLSLWYSNQSFDPSDLWHITILLYLRLCDMNITCCKNLRTPSNIQQLTNKKTPFNRFICAVVTAKCFCKHYYYSCCLSWSAKESTCVIIFQWKMKVILSICFARFISN